MEEVRRNLLVGLFVLVGLGILGTLVVLFGAGPMAIYGTRGYTLNIQFESGRGIREGNQVTIGGIEVGRVHSVAFFDPTRFDIVNVTVSVNREVRLPMGSTAYTTEPMLGQGRPPIEIVPGPRGNPLLEPGTTIKGTVRGAVEAFLPPTIINTLERTATHLGDAAAALTPVLNEMHEVLIKRSPADVDRLGGPQGNLSSALARLDSGLKHFNDVLGDPQTKSHLKESVKNIHATTAEAKAIATKLHEAVQTFHDMGTEGKSLLSKTGSAVDEIRGDFASASRDLRGVLERLSRVADSTYEVFDGIKKGEGTVGRLVRDAKLYEALVVTMQRLAETIEEFKVTLKDWQQRGVKFR